MSTAATESRATPTRRPSGPRVAYVVSRFPRLTETFVVDEVAAVVRAGAEVTLHPLHHQRDGVVQPTAEALAPRVRYRSLVGPRTLGAFLREAARAPRAVLDAAGTILGENWGSRRLLVGAAVAFPSAVALARELRDEGVEHLHCHFATHPAAVGWVVHALTGIPFSFTAHGSDLHRDRHMLPTKVADARFVVTVSEFNRQVIVATCGAGCRHKVHVVPCGIDARQLPARSRPPRLPGSPLHVCCVGTLHAVKGQAVLVEACRRLVDRGVDVRCTLVGDGPDRAALEAQARAGGLSERLRVTGRVTRPEVLAVLQGADALVAPSVPTADGRREGLPVAILEAMAVGVPVVASRLSGIPEAVEDGVTGLLVAPGDTEGVATALHRIASDPAAADHRAGTAARRVASDFDLDRSAQRLVRLFSEAAP